MMHPRMRCLAAEGGGVFYLLVFLSTAVVGVVSANTQQIRFNLSEPYHLNLAALFPSCAAPLARCADRSFGGAEIGEALREELDCSQLRQTALLSRVRFEDFARIAPQCAETKIR